MRSDRLHHHPDEHVRQLHVATLTDQPEPLDSRHVAADRLAVHADQPLGFELSRVLFAFAPAAMPDSAIRVAWTCSTAGRRPARRHGIDDGPSPARAFGRHVLRGIAYPSRVAELGILARARQ
jgi:hypothetical protein